MERYQVLITPAVLRNIEKRVPRKLRSAVETIGHRKEVYRFLGR